ncbi:MAG: RIP metalloprotease RseP [Firmicutes bacterium]|nr:RIP metalloprotease RseP [Bacillota bacterium]
MSVIINLLLFVLILGSIVFVHEAGHFIFAKICGVYVYEFALGMGPKLFSKKGKETEYSLRAIPIGGFCQMAGEDLDTDKSKKVPKNKQLQSKTAFQRFLIMFFGPCNNFIFAVIILFFIALIWGGSTMKPVISDVEKNYPAYEAGLRKNDTIVKINNHKVSTSDDVTLYFAVADPIKGSKIQVKDKDGILQTYRVIPKKEQVKDQTSYRYGISIEQEKTRGFINSIIYTYKKTCSIFKQMAVTVGYLFTGGIKLTQLSGPVGIYSIVGSQSKTGLANILYLVAFLSINVGFINLIPLPAFDGGHILFIIIEKIKGSPVNPETENKIHTIGLFLLMLLMIFITFNDILRLF